MISFAPASSGVFEALIIEILFLNIKFKNKHIHIFLSQKFENNQLLLLNLINTNGPVNAKEARRLFEELPNLPKQGQGVYQEQQAGGKPVPAEPELRNRQGRT